MNIIKPTNIITTEIIPRKPSMVLIIDNIPGSCKNPMLVAKKESPTQRSTMIINAIIGAKNQVKPIFKLRFTIYQDFDLDLLVNLKRIIKYTTKIVINEKAKLNGPSIMEGKIKLISTTIK